MDGGMNAMKFYMNSVSNSTPLPTCDPDDFPITQQSDANDEEMATPTEILAEKSSGWDEKAIDDRVAKKIDMFNVIVPPLPPGSQLPEDIWTITQTSRALKDWLTKHLGENYSFSPVELMNGVAIERCLEQQRRKIRRQLLEDAGVLEIPRLSSVEAARNGDEIDIIMAGGEIPAEEEPSVITVEEDFETHPVRRVPVNWPVRRVYVVNVPEGALRYNATKLGDFDTAAPRALAHKTLLYLMGKCCIMTGRPLVVKRGKGQSNRKAYSKNKNRKNKNEPADSESTNETTRAAEQRQFLDADDQLLEDCHRFDFCPNGEDGPKFNLLKTTQIIEQVTTVTGENKGWRIFIFIHGENINIGQAMSRQIKQNLKTYRRQLATANNKTGTQRDRSRTRALCPNVGPLCYENPTKHRELLNRVVIPYISFYDTKLAEKLRGECSQERKIERIDDPDGPLHPRHYLGLEQALKFSKIQGVRDRQTELIRYRQPADKVIEEKVKKALECKLMAKCMQCKQPCNKMIFNPVSREQDDVIMATSSHDDSMYYTTSSSDDDDDDEDDDNGFSSSSTTTTAGSVLGDGIQEINQICCDCTQQTKICEKCNKKLHLSCYDDARSPICSGCRWVYCFPQPYACWRIHIDDMSPEGLHEMHLPQVKTTNDPDLQPNQTSYIYGDEVFTLEGGILDSTNDEDIQKWEESMQIGTDKIICPGLDPLTATLTNMSDKIVDRSRLLQLRQELIPKRTGIEGLLWGDPERYQEKMAKFKEEACFKFWKKMWSMEPAIEFSPVTIKGMAYLEKHMPDRLWPEHNQAFCNMSLYGNMRLFYHQNFTRHFRLKEGLMPRSLWKLILARDSALEYDYGLRVNILEDGEGSTGKSYNMDCMTELSYEGSIHKTTHISPQAFNTDQDWNYVCIVMHECPLQYLGIDAYGHQVEGCEFIKDRLTSNVCQSDRCNWDGGKASRSSSFSRCMGNMIMATNANPPPTDTPLMQRFLREVVIKYPGGSYDVADIAEPMGDEMDQQTKGLFVHESRMRHVFIMIVERAIEAGFFHDVNTNLVVIYFKRIFQRLHDKYKIAKTPIRIRHMLLKLCRIACIKHAVYWEYCTELSRWRFKEDGKTFREFDPLSLINLERKLVVTEEMIADVLSLFQDSFIPTLTQKFLEQCKILCGLDSVTKTVKNHRYRRCIVAGREQIDYNYVEFDEGSLAKFYDRIWNMTKGQLTPGIISAKLLELKKRFVEVDNRNYRPQQQKQQQQRQQQQQQQQRHQTLKQNQARINIPCAEVVQKPGSRRCQSVCVAIDAMCVKLDEAALLETIQWALSHACARPRRIISSFVHIGPDNYAYPHLLHTIDIEQNEKRVLSVRNHLAMTRLDQILYNRVHSNTQHNVNAAMDSDYITVFGEDAETSTYRMHWRKIGAYWPGWADEKYDPLIPVAVYDLPWIFMDRIWKYRNQQEKETYKTLIEFQVYPDELRLLHQARLDNAKRHVRNMEGQEEGLNKLSAVMKKELNPKTARGTYSNWGLTSKCYVKRTKQKRNLVEKFFNIAANDPLTRLPINNRSSGFIRKRQETIKHKQLVQKAFEDDDAGVDTAGEDTETEMFGANDYYDDDDDKETTERFDFDEFRTEKRKTFTAAPSTNTITADSSQESPKKKTRSSYVWSASSSLQHTVDKEKAQQRGLEKYLKGKGSFSDPLDELIHMPPRRKTKKTTKEETAAQRIHMRREARQRGSVKPTTQKQRRRKKNKKKRRTSKLARGMEYDYYRNNAYNNKLQNHGGDYPIY